MKEFHLEETRTKYRHLKFFHQERNNFMKFPLFAIISPSYYDDSKRQKEQKLRLYIDIHLFNSIN